MSENNFDIAIVGMSGQFPDATNLQSFWQNLVTKKECLKHFTHEELAAANVSPSEWSLPNYIPTAGIVQDIDLFAADFFGYSPRDASLIDPQQRKLLEEAWLALEDAGINPYRYAGNIGVFVGSSLNTYLLNNLLSHPNMHKAEDLQQILFGNGQDYLATRIAYLLNLRGPAINVQTACSTSLVAVHEACQYLLSYQVDVALAGGVSLSVPQTKGYLYSVDGMLSPDGHCRPFSKTAEGTVFSSGLGIVVLKRLVDAKAEGDAIYAVIKGSAVNNDGRQKVGYTAPSVDGQAEVIALAQGLANVTPNQVNFIETHGTATSLGDLIEISALQKVFANDERKQFCALGSLKSNIGHLDVAAGIAGLIKTALALHHKKIPATLHCEQPTKKFNWQDSAFYVNQEMMDWEGESGTRIAGVSSFGIGGTNAHVVLGDAKTLPSNTCDKPALLIFSAKTTTELELFLEKMHQYCLAHPQVSIHSLARTLQVGRAEFQHRAAMVVYSIEDFLERLRKKDYALVTCQQELNLITPKPIEQCDESSLSHLMQQWLQGHVINWTPHYEHLCPQKLHLPGYCFTRSRYWIDPYLANESDNKKLNIDEWFYAPGFRKSLFCEAMNKTKDAILLLLIDESQLNDECLLPLQSYGRIIKVMQGSHFQQIRPDLFTMNFSVKQEYLTLLENLKTNSSLPTHLLHTLSLTKQWQETSYHIFETQQKPGLLSLIYFIQAFESAMQDQSLKITVLTNRLNQIANDAMIEPHKAPLLAAVKVVPKEFVKIGMQLIDIDAMDHPQFNQFQFEQIGKEVFKDHYDQEEIIYRGSQRWLRDYIQTPIPSAIVKPTTPTHAKIILITGGLGQLGLDIADYFAQLKNHKIALLARTKIPHDSEWNNVMTTLDEEHPLRIMLQRILAMRSQGANVEVFSADVGDYDSLNHAILQIEEKMGLITGLVHAAGETVNGIISLKTEDSLQESYQAKVVGTYHLHQIFQHKKCDFQIYCSSMNAIIGGLGQLDNTSANAFIDYMADYMSAKTGQNIFAINWGAVNVNRPMKVNVLHQFMELSTEHKKNRMTDDEVNQVYDRLLSHRPGSRIVISTIDMNSILKNWNRVASIEELAKDRPSYQQSIERLPNENESPLSEIEQWVSDRWSQLLGINAIGLKDNFFALGGHSLAAVQFISKIKETYQIKTHVMNLYELPTLEEFSNFLEKRIKQKGLPSYGLANANTH